MRGVALVLWVSALTVGCAAASDGPPILERAPASPDPDARYLFYLHGRIIEVQGPEAVSPDFGRYEYQRILEAFAARGFVVVAEVREDGAGAAFVEATARQVRGLLEAGVPADHVVVVGFSKGAVLTLGVSAEVSSDDVRYAILAGCRSDSAWASALGPRLRGRFLSLRDRSDRHSAPCGTLFAHADRVRDRSEHVFDTGLDHGLFYRPREDWVNQLVAWAGAAGPSRGQGSGAAGGEETSPAR